MTSLPILPVLLAYGFEDRRTGYGEWQTVRCPFHDDSHASARLNEEQGVFKCHACQVSGDAIAVVMQHEGIGFEDAKRRVQGITGVSGSQIRSGTGNRLASSKLPQWTRDRRAGNSRRLSSGRGRREHS